MKKFLFLMIGIPTLIFGQWTENFDSGTSLPAGWISINANDWFVSDQGLGAAQSGENIVMGQTAGSYLITKAINVQAGVSDRISFYASHMSGNGNFEYCDVLLSTTHQTATAFTTVLQNSQSIPYNWTKMTYSLAAYVGQTIYVAIKTKPNMGELWVDSFKVDTSSTLSTSNISKVQENSKAYPNPFTDVLNISKPDLVKSVSVSDTSGRLVKIIDNPSLAIHLRDLQQGLYFVTLNMKDGSKQSMKAIKK